MVPLVLLLIGCLEKVTGEDVPLDCRFYGCDEDAGRRGSADHEDNAAAEGAGETPWGAVTGEKVKITGMVVGPDDTEVQMDVNEPDKDSPGGQKRVGALHLPPGEFELSVPVAVTKFGLEAFQDPDGDGPSETDPYASASVELPLTGELKLEMVSGARTARANVPAPPGAPGGDPSAGNPGGSGPPGGQPGAPPKPADPFGDVPKITLRGTITASTELPVFIDFFKVDPTSPGGRTYLFKVQATGGTFEAQVPKDFGTLDVEAYQDPNNDGPTATDPRGRLGTPLVAGASDVDGLAITVQ